MTQNPAINLKSLLQLAHTNGISDGFLPFWAGMLAELLVPIGPLASVVEFGATSPKFLQLLSLAFPYRTGLGVVLDIDSVTDTTLWSTESCIFVPEELLGSTTDLFDFAFSHELFSLLPHLGSHAEAAWKLLAAGGTYYAAFGWHTDNPHVPRHAKLRSDQGIPFFAYSLDDIARVFHEVGFEVAYKRLPLAYFMVYEPGVVSRRFGSVSEMISCLQDHKILFVFRKDGDV